VKVGTKFALAFLICALLSVLVYSSVAASQEVVRLEATVAEDLASLGRTLSASVMAVRDRDGDAHAIELVGYHDRDDAIEARWTWLDGADDRAHAPSAPASALADARRGKIATWVDEPKAGRERRVFAYVPLGGRGRAAALQLSRPLVGQSSIFWTEIREQLAGSAVVAALATLLAATLASVLVSRPLARVGEQARRIGAGDLSQRLPVRGHDEVAALVADLNVMCDQLRDAQERADAEGQKRIRALEQLRHADRLRTVGTLASGIAHELGTPLAVIGMRAKMITTGEVADGDAVESARVIASQSDRVAKIVRQLLDFARRRTPNAADVDLQELAERTIGLLGALARTTNVTLAVVPGDAPIVARVDAAQLEQAITNLLINAVHAMPGGGRVDVRVGATSRTRPGGTAPEACVFLEVEDQGVGIAPADLERIFEPFFTTKGVGEGTGLGLSVAHGIALDHAGWMHAESTPGAGSTFRIYLPAPGATAQPSSRASESEAG
jgi:signal transduction histidine kinase